ncbi:MAG: START domain-containing protein [Thermodesulfobacteriota bacterium]|nr:START domain-containing protein [Thermodesulfobacteriota bacterium]
MNGPKVKAAFAVVFCLMFLAASAGAKDGEWELILSEDGIDTYRMTHPGTDVCTFKGVGFVDARMEVVGCVIRDIPSYPEWMADFKDTTIVKTIDRNTYIFHCVINAPFPYKDRDILINNEAVYNLENGTAQIIFGVETETLFPEKSQYYRLSQGQLEGKYYIEFFGRNKTRVTYMHRAHPGGNIPVSIANMLKIRHYPATNIKGLRMMSKKEKYIQAGLVSPENELIENMLADSVMVREVLKTRIGEYITDPVLLDLMFDTDMAAQIVGHVHEKNATFESVKQAVIDMLNIVATEGLKGDMQSEVYHILTYVADKRFENFFNMKKFMQETWLVDAVAARKDLIRGLLNKNSDLAKVMFDKITASEPAVTCFIQDDDLAEKILNDASIRQKLWEDEVLREQIIEHLGDFDSLKAFEALVEERVDSYL